MPESPIDQFQAFLEQKGLRLTRERRLVAETVFSLTAPLNGESVLESLIDIFQRNVSRSTIYRTLALIEESGLASVETVSSGDLSPLCAAAHANLIAGRCPWCGRDITHGKPHDPA